MATVTRTNGSNGRGFEGPFIILGMLPGWPAEFERRAGYTGPHSNLTSLLPIALPPVMPPVAPPALAAPKPAPRNPRGLIGGINSERELTRRLSPRFMGWLEELVPFLAVPRTARQCSRFLGCARPTAYALLEMLRRRKFPLVYGARRAGQRGPKGRTFQLVPHV
jgi:hypothetical protein